MGSIAAVADHRRNEAALRVLQILKTLKHRGSTSLYVIHNGKLCDVTETKLRLPKSTYAIGFSSSDKNDTMIIPYLSYVMDGEIYHDNKILKMIEIHSLIDDNHLEVSLEKIVKEREGIYAIASLSDQGIFACCDPLGCKPLYYGSRCGLSALSSERKGLWELGIQWTYSLPPGSIVKIDTDIHFNQVYQLVRSYSQVNNFDVAIERTLELLQLSIQKRLGDTDEVAVPFSGGIDSSLIAYLVSKSGIRLKLYTISIGERPELTQALQNASALGLPLEVIHCTREEVESYLTTALWLIEEPNPLKLEIALPFLILAQYISKNGLQTVFLGQGGDELFGGYKRFNEIYCTKGSSQTEHEIYVSILNSYLSNFQRDEPLFTLHNLSCRYPFYDLSLVKYALTIPASFNLSVKNDLRKRVLREVGKILGFSPEIYKAPKKAIQYGSGVHKVIHSLARERKLTIQNLVMKEFNQVFQSVKL